MTYLQFLLVIHVLGAIVGFGSTFAFAFFPQEARAPRASLRTTLADVSYKIDDEVLGSRGRSSRNPSPGP